MMHRLFIGIRPPQEVRTPLLDMMDGIRGARWQDDDQLHVTLRFIGELSRHDSNDLAEALHSIAVPPFPITIDGVGQFERKGYPRALWVRIVPSEPLAQLKRKIDRTCRQLGHPYEHRKFLPHITIARLNSSSGPTTDFIAAHASLRPPSFTVNNFALYESHLGEAGSRYEEILDYPLI